MILFLAYKKIKPFWFTSSLEEYGILIVLYLLVSSQPHCCNCPFVWQLQRLHIVDYEEPLFSACVLYNISGAVRGPYSILVNPFNLILAFERFGGQKILWLLLSILPRYQIETNTWINAFIPMVLQRHCPSGGFCCTPSPIWYWTPVSECEVYI